MDHPPPIPYASPGTPRAVEAIPPTAPMPTSPLEIQAQLAAAHLAAKKVHRLAGVATFDAWSIAICAVPSVICGVSGGASGLLLGVVMGVTAYVEFRGAAAIRRLDVTSPSRQAYNQLVLAGSIILYSLWCIHTADASGGLAAELQQAGMGNDLGALGGSGQLDSLNHSITWALYGGLILLTILFQGGMALYYFRRQETIAQYLAETPAWVVEMQRKGTPL
jgi:hypothetical protein